MFEPPKPVRTGVILVLVALFVLVGLTGLTAWAGRPTDGQIVGFLPLMFGAPPPTPTPTFTPTPTSSPTPTATVTPSCGTTSIAGTYYTVGSNLTTTCSAGIALPAPTDTLVTQDGVNLTMVFPSGTSTGTINLATGEFQVQQMIAASPTGCVYGCTRSTIGTFRLSADPTVFNAVTTFTILNSSGGPYCTFSFDHDGTRTKCP